MKKHIVLGAVLLASWALAEDRVLIVGVSEYSDPGNNLPGVKFDVGYAKDIAVRMGVKPDKIRVITDRNATREGILQGMKWAMEGASAKDRVMVYYSGHGNQITDLNQDEADGCDETIVPYDMNEITDDEINLAVQKSRAQEVLLVMDSCFSGTISKSILPVTGIKRFDRSKALNRVGECAVGTNKSSKATPRGTAVVPESGKLNGPQVLELSAASDQQYALDGTSYHVQGSLFTYALHQKLVVQNSKQVSFSDLRNYAAEYIRGVANNRAHTPQLFGSETQLKSNVLTYFGANEQVPDAEPSPESFSTYVQSLLNGSSFAVEVTSNQLSFVEGDAIEYTIKSSKAGYLNVLELDSENNLTLLYPNAYTPNANKINADQKVRLPGDFKGFALRAVKPYGKSHVLAVVTTEPLNLFTDKGLGQVMQQFKVLTDVNARLLAAKTAKATGLFATSAPAPSSPLLGAGMVTINVKEGK